MPERKRETKRHREKQIETEIAREMKRENGVPVCFSVEVIKTDQQQSGGEKVM